MFRFYEFFAGGGMARAGLESEGWRCLFSNDFDAKKGEIYNRNWGEGVLLTADVKTVVPEQLPDAPDLVWASFPCQDLSLAGARAGLQGERSGTFWPFWRLMTELIAQGRGPKIFALENVYGTLTSHHGEDFSEICGAIAAAGYRVGAMIIDAALFLPQSRPRLFVIGVAGAVAGCCEDAPDPKWHPPRLIEAQKNLPEPIRSQWIWWRLPAPPTRNASFADLLESDPSDVHWWSPEKTDYLISLMADAHLEKLAQAKKSGRVKVGAIYRRTRRNAEGVKLQRAEVRFDDLAGCLRTPSGGSSRQLIMIVNGEDVRVRLISGRETARLMGLAEDYMLPAGYNDAYHLTGDGVAVPVVRHLRDHIFEPILRGA